MVRERSLAGETTWKGEREHKEQEQGIRERRGKKESEGGQSERRRRRLIIEGGYRHWKSGPREANKE